MDADPYLLAWLRQRRNQLRAQGFLGAARDLAVLAAAVGVLVPLVRPSFLSFLDHDPSFLAEGVHQIVLRASMVVVGWLAIDVYGVLIRAPSRRVLAALPVDPAGVVRAELLSLGLARSWLVPAFAALLLPVALHGAVEPWVRACAALASCWWLGLVASANAHLLAIRVAESPRFVALLDLVRGQNPRAAAAFLYAPGAVLAACGGLLAVSSAAVAQEGLLATLGLVAPAIVGTALLVPLPALARGSWFRGSAVLADIDARYAQHVDREDARRVYLEWAIRFLPASWRRYALDDLRHGWRTRRSLVTGGWLLGLAAMAAGWTDPAHAGFRAVAAVVVGMLAVAANGVLMSVDEPRFLRISLPRVGVAAAAGRAAAVSSWALPVWVLGTAGALGDGAEVAARVAVAGGLALIAGLGLGWACSRLAERALAVYGPVAAVVAGVLVMGIT